MAYAARGFLLYGNQADANQFEEDHRQIETLMPVLAAATLQAEGKRLMSDLKATEEDYYTKTAATIKAKMGNAPPQEFDSDLGLAAAAVMPLQNNLDQFVTYETKRLEQEREEIYASNRETMLVIWLTCGLGVILTLFLALRSAKGISHAVVAASRLAAEVADGNLDATSVRATGSGDELEVLGHAMNKMLANLRDMVGRIREYAGNLASSAGDITQATEQVAEGSQQQSQETMVLREVLQNLAETARRIMNGSGEAAAKAAVAGSMAEKGRQVTAGSVAGMKEITGRIERLREDSRKIGGIVEIIDAIAGQTNLLALNAAIEAARAGEQGRGFAVVAEEVRGLAEKVAVSTRDIGAIVREIQERVDDTVETATSGAGLIDQAATFFQDITGHVVEVNQAMGAINTGIQAQAASVEKSVAAVGSMSSLIDGNAAAAQETAASAQHLSAIAAELEGLVNRFRLKQTGWESGEGPVTGGEG